MDKHLVLYYSKTGNSKFLAEKVSKELCCDIKSISPSINALVLLLILSGLKVSIGVNISKKELENYEEIIVFGPIWAGALVSPLRSVLKKCVKASKPIHFAVSCETSDEDKNKKYGYAKVLEEAKEVGGALVKTTEAFSTALVKTGEEKKAGKMEGIANKIILTDINFKGAIKNKLDAFLEKIK